MHITSGFGLFLIIFIIVLVFSGINKKPLVPYKLEDLAPSRATIIAARTMITVFWLTIVGIIYLLKG